MAKKRSKRRRKTGRVSLSPSSRPFAAPSNTEPALDVKSPHEASEESPDAPPNEDVDKTDRLSASEDDSRNKPAKDAKAEPDDLEGEEPGSQPAADDASEAGRGAAPGEDAEAKHQGKHDPDQDDGDSGTGEEAAQDDGLHDDFFRKGEEVEQEHIAAQVQAVNGSPKLEDTGQRQLVALRTTPEMIARRKKLRRIVGYVLAPAVVIAVIAVFKAYDSQGNAAARASAPVATVTVQPPAREPGNVPSVSTPPLASPVSSVAAADAGESAQDAALGADALVDVALDVPAEIGPDVDSLAAADARDEASEPEAEAGAQSDVDHRKEALMALNRAQWKQAEAMARAAIESDPTNATLYLYQGTALQEMGRRDEARAVFKRCVEHAKSGPINECRMFAQ